MKAGFSNFDKGSPQRYIYVGRLEPVKNPCAYLKPGKTLITNLISMAMVLLKAR